MSGWPDRIAWAESFALAFHRWPGHYAHTFVEDRIVVTSEPSGEVFDHLVDVRELAPGLILFRFPKPSSDETVHVDAIVDFDARIAVAVHQAARLHGSARPRLVLERASVGCSVELDALIAAPSWEHQPGTFGLEGTTTSATHGVRERARLASPERGRVLVLRPHVVLMLIEQRAATVAAFVNLDHDRFLSSSLHRGDDGSRSLVTDTGRAVFTPCR